MGLIKDANRFNQLRQKIQDDSQKKKKFTDDRFIEFKPGNTYRFRLIGYTPDNSEREDFLASKYKHMVKTEDGKWHGVTCPTTLNKTGFEKCPVCKKNRELYTSKNPIDNELYKKYRRKFDGYAIVYVISDPVNESYNNTFKIIRYGTTIDKWLRKEIWGIVSATPDDDSEEVETVTESVGLDAINIVNGYDLIIEVSQKGEWADYACKFARKPTTLNLKEEDIIKKCEELDLDSELKISSDAQLTEFYEKVILNNTSDSSEASDSTSINIDTIETTTKSSVTAEVPKSEKKKEKVVEKPIVDELNMDDIENLINELS